MNFSKKSLKQFFDQGFGLKLSPLKLLFQCKVLNEVKIDFLKKGIVRNCFRKFKKKNCLIYSTNSVLPVGETTELTPSSKKKPYQNKNSAPPKFFFF